MGEGCPPLWDSCRWRRGGQQQQVGVLRACGSCSSTSSRRHPEALARAGDDYILSGVRNPACHTAHALPEKFEFVCPRHFNERRASLPTSLASLGQLRGLPRQDFSSRCYLRPRGLISVLRRDAAAELCAISIRKARLPPQTGGRRTRLCKCSCLWSCMFS